MTGPVLPSELPTSGPWSWLHAATLRPTCRAAHTGECAPAEPEETK